MPDNKVTTKESWFPSKDTVYAEFKRVHLGVITNAQFSEADVVLISKSLHSCYEDAVEALRKNREIFSLLLKDTIIKDKIAGILKECDSFEDPNE